MISHLVHLVPFVGMGAILVAYLVTLFWIVCLPTPEQYMAHRRILHAERMAEQERMLEVIEGRYGRVMDSPNMTMDRPYGVTTLAVEPTTMIRSLHPDEIAMLEMKDGAP